MKFRPTILLLIALIPAVFYTVYEFLSLSKTDQLMTEIYEKQMDNVLFDINQNAWERTSNWADNFEGYLSKNSNLEKDSLIKILHSEPGIQCVFITDSLLDQVKLYISNDTSNIIELATDEIQEKLLEKQSEIDRMFYRKNIGYDKPVSFMIESKGNQVLSLLYIYENNDKQIGIFGICINSKRFMETLPIVLDETPQEDIEVGIFDEKSGKTIDKIGDITLKNAAAIKKVWLFPNYSLGVKMKGVDLNEQVKNRFFNRLKWTILLNSLLIISLVFIFRSFRSEMRLTRIKSDFVSNVSHELRTPLALIRMYSETLSMNRVRTEEKKHEYYNVITKESERLSHLVNTILDFSKMESGNKKYNYEVMDLNKIIQDVMEMYSFHLTQKKFQHSINISDDKLMINGDISSISEAIINLIDNGMKYSGDVKEITIESGTENNQCWVQVSDKGQGISNSDLTRIFDKFYRVSSSLVHNTKGSGLGLALVDYIMKAHDGTISVKSKKGKGSTFRLNFPKIEA